MILKTNTLLVLALTMMSLVAGSPGSVRNLKRNLKEDTPKGLTVKRIRGEDDGPDEVDLSLKVFTCEKGTDACNNIPGEDEEAKEVSMKKFREVLMNNVLSALEDDDDDDEKDGNDRRLDYYCDWWYWCDCCYCYYYYDCYWW